MEREEQTKLWSNASQKVDYYKFTAGLYAPVDTVHFVGVSHTPYVIKDFSTFLKCVRCPVYFLLS